MEDAVGHKRSRDASAEPESPVAAKRSRAEILLHILDDDEADASPADDLASVMKFFEEEIALPSPPPPAAVDLEVPPQIQPQAELGYLLEASDDELGLPPTSAPSSSAETEEVAAVDAAADAGFGQIWGLEDDIGCGFGAEFLIRPEAGEEGVVFDGGLFDYADALGWPSDFGEFSWRSESLPAV